MKQLTCTKESNFCYNQRKEENLPDLKCHSQPHPSTVREWSRTAPMGVFLNPRVIPPTKSTSDECNQTNIQVIDPVTMPKRSIIAKDYEINPRLKTMYQYHYNDSADALLRYCDNRTITERIAYFRNCQRVQEDLYQTIKDGAKGKIRRYRSNYNKRMSEYMAETSYIGGKILKSKIHDHSKCGSTAGRCVHYIDF